jgi:hypothetical protein
MAATQGWVAVNTTNVEESILHSSEIQAFRLGNGADTTIVPWKFGETLADVLASAESVRAGRDSGGEAPGSRPSVAASPPVSPERKKA